MVVKVLRVNDWGHHAPSQTLTVGLSRSTSRTNTYCPKSLYTLSYKHLLFALLEFLFHSKYPGDISNFFDRAGVFCRKNVLACE